MKIARGKRPYHFKEIINSFSQRFKTGQLKFTKIKAIKRAIYIFRNFDKYPPRILISFKNGFFSTNYKHNIKNIEIHR